THLFVLGILSFASGTIGRTARRQLWRGWLRLHITGMAISYILLLTAFYVDNGPHLPLWRSLPPLVHWLLPSLVGLPLLVRTLRRHPLVLRNRALRQPSAGTAPMGPDPRSSGGTETPTPPPSLSSPTPP